MNRDDGVDTFAFNDFLLDDRLGNMVDVMVNILVNPFAKVDDGAFLSAVNFRVLVLGSKTLEERSVFSGRGVTLVDFGDWNSVGVVNFILDLLVNNRLDVMLDVVNMSVNFSLSLDFLNLDMTVIGMDDVVQMLVVMSDVLSSWVELGSDAVIVTSGVVEVRSTGGGSS